MLTIVVALLKGGYMFLYLVCMISLAIVQGETTPQHPDSNRKDIDALERQAKVQVTASDAFLLYQQYRKSNAITDDLRVRFDERYSEWEDRAEKKLVRLGRKWVTAEERQKVALVAREAVGQANKLIKLGDFAGAKINLERASRQDPNGILADFILGLLNSGRLASVTVSHPETAVQHFRKVLLRSPSHVGAINNLAVAYMKQGDERSALRYWEQAHELAPKNSQVAHNVARVLFESARGRVKVKSSSLRRLRLLVTATDLPRNERTSRPSWAISPAIVPDIERLGENAEQAAATTRRVVSGSQGTGFVIRAGYILTNRHVVRDQLYGTADVIQLSIPGRHDAPVLAEVVGISTSSDLALLKSDGLQAPALMLSTEMPRLGVEVMALGFPRTQILGMGLKATRGSISALPEKSFRRLLYDAIVNAGNSGGPLLTQDGSVVAVNTFYHHTIGQPISGGVPMEDAIAFIKQHLPDFTGVNRKQSIEWPDVADLGAKSTVLVSVLFADAAPLIANAEGADAQREFLLDPSCAHCRGWGKIPCPNPKCSGGGVLNFKTVTRLQVANKIGSTSTSTRQSFKVKCSTCSGANAVNCPFCSGNGLAQN